MGLDIKENGLIVNGVYPGSPNAFVVTLDGRKVLSEPMFHISRGLIRILVKREMDRDEYHPFSSAYHSQIQRDLAASDGIWAVGTSRFPARFGFLVNIDPVPFG